MHKSENIGQLLHDLRQCLAEADEMQLDMAAVYIAHAIEHLEHIESVRSPETVLRSVKGGKLDD